MSALVLYDAACRALLDAVTADEIGSVRLSAIGIEAVARAAKDFGLQINAVKLQVRAEAKLGDLLREADENGQIYEGRPPKQNGSAQEPFPKFTLKEIGIDKKLSARAQKLSGIGDRAVRVMLEQFERQSQEKHRLARDVISRATDQDKKQRRADREISLAAMQRALPNKKYGVIYADPEWRFEVYSRETGMDRSADNHYPTSITDEISQRPVEQIAAPDCVLFLWATVPMLPDAIDVMRAWGFDYKSHCMWRKDRIGTGYWFRNAHELLLVGTRGKKIPAPAMGEQWESVIDASVTKHSAKPDKFYDLIEEYFPNLPKIELNARRARPGWDAWGLEAPESIPPHDPVTGEIRESGVVP
jgi:N6-adenosine-specific RNA methylase IME4